MAKNTSISKEMNDTSFDILKSFFPEGKERTLKQIMEKTGYTYEPVYRTVQWLVKKGMLYAKKFGRTLVYTVNLKRTQCKVAYWIYATERASDFSNKKSEIFTALSELPEEETDFLAVFGSFAKGKERKGSDIDLLCVTSDKKKTEDAIASIKRRHNLDIQAVIMPRAEFAKIKKENPEFWNDLVIYGVIFKGYEIFYYHAYAI